MAFKCIKAFYHLENSLILLTPTINDNIRLQVSWKQCFLDGHHDSSHFSVPKSIAQVLCRNGLVLKRPSSLYCKKSSNVFYKSIKNKITNDIHSLKYYNII